MDSYDAWKTTDTEGDRYAEQESEFERAVEVAWSDYLETGDIAGTTMDASNVDDLLGEHGLLDDLLKARDDDELLDVAKKIRDARMQIVDNLIRESIEL